MGPCREFPFPLPSLKTAPLSNVSQSVDLTRLPVAPVKPPGGSSSTTATAPSPSTQTPPPPTDTPTAEYSSREVKPSALLLQDLLRAHSIFLLHHASSLSALFVRTQRDKFVSLLSRYWDLFLSTWNVLLHGNPACGVYGGIKIAACGELGIGVGEEERGSGERDVLEGLIGGVEGLVDLVVGRFGGEEGQGKGEEGGEEEMWLGTGNEPGAEDGAVFLGSGVVSRHSLKAIAYWMEDVFTWGENAYGVVDRPTSTRTLKKRRERAKRGAVPREGQLGETRTQVEAQADDGGSSAARGAPSKLLGEEHDEHGSGMDKVFSYLKLGYGTAWSLGGSSSKQPGVGEDAGKQDDAAEAATPPKPPKNDSAGRFLIGLVGDVESGRGSEDNPSSQEQGEDESLNSRTLVRTLSVELEREVGDELAESLVTKDLGSPDTELAEERLGTDGHITEDPNTSFDSQDRNKTKRLRVVVYAAKPFIFVFLFHPRTVSLELEGLYRSLHSRLTPIHKALVSSTAYRPERPDMGSATSAEIYDLIWDPRLLTVHSTIPNIPDPLFVANTAGGAAPVWSRVEALNTHNQILNMFMATREGLSEFERTCKTSRGWWIVWNRILEQVGGPDSPGGKSHDMEDSDGTEAGDEGERGSQVAASVRDLVVNKEIFLIRRASDHAGGTVRSISSSYVGGGSGGGWADGASRLAQGIGVDTRRYIEGLLSLNR